jgi:hypothetical protein
MKDSEGLKGSEDVKACDYLKNNFHYITLAIEELIKQKKLKGLTKWIQKQKTKNKNK